MLRRATPRRAISRRAACKMRCRRSALCSSWRVIYTRKDNLTCLKVKVVASCRRYVLKNYLKHLDSAQMGWMDDFSSEKHSAATVMPVSWLLGGRGWPRG